MRVEFTLPIKAFSLNAYRYGHSPHKTKAAREFEEDVLQRLKLIPPLELMAEKWRKNYGVIEVEFVFVYPSSVFLNAQGRVSAKTFDLTNCEKILLDLILNRHVGIDDRFVTRLTSSKTQGSQHEIQVLLELRQCSTKTLQNP